MTPDNISTSIRRWGPLWQWTASLILPDLDGSQGWLVLRWRPALTWARADRAANRYVASW